MTSKACSFKFGLVQLVFLHIFVAYATSGRLSRSLRVHPRGRKGCTGPVRYAPLTPFPDPGNVWEGRKMRCSVQQRREKYDEDRAHGERDANCGLKYMPPMPLLYRGAVARLRLHATGSW